MEVFDTILAFFDPSCPLEPWKELREKFVIDIRHRFRNREVVQDAEEAEKYILLEIENFLQSIFGKMLVDFGLPATDPALDLLIEQVNPAELELNSEQARKDLRKTVSKINEGQLTVFNEFVGIFYLASLPRMVAARETSWIQRQYQVQKDVCFSGMLLVEPGRRLWFEPYSSVLKCE